MEGPSRNLDSTKPQKIRDRYGIDTLNKGFYKKNGKKRSEEEYVLSPVRGAVMFSVLFFYWELITMLFTHGNAGGNVIYLLESSVIAGMVLSIVSGIFPNATVNYVISTILKIGAAGLFVIQILYYHIEGRFFSVMHSDLSGYQFGKDILPAMMACLLEILLILLPLLLSVILYVWFYRLGEDILGYRRRNGMCYVLVVLIGILAYAGLILTVRFNDNTKTPVYEIYQSRDADYNEKVANFGVLTSVSKDVIQEIFQ